MLPRFRVTSTVMPLFLIGCLGLAQPAQAEFQWVAPNNPPPAPVVTGNDAPVMPVIIGGAPDHAAPAEPAEIPIYKTPANGNPPPEFAAPTAVKTPEPLLAAPSMPAVAGPSGGQDVVHGFAKNVPVVVALRQILPPGYAFSIDPKVDMGTLISFQGGQPWRTTLRNALVPVGLSLREQGQMVMIGYADDNRIAENKTPVYQPGMAPHGLQPPVTVMPLDNRPDFDQPIVPVIIQAPVGPSSPGQAAPAPVSSRATPDIQEWYADRGSSLHKVLSDWCRIAHVEFNWIAEYDYPLDASVKFSGTFQEAVRNLLAGFEAAHPQPVAELHDNPGLGQMVLVVQTRGNTGTD